MDKAINGNTPDGSGDGDGTNDETENLVEDSCQYFFPGDVQMCFRNAHMNFE